MTSYNVAGGGFIETVTAIVCAKDSEAELLECVSRLLSLSVSEIIVVDGSNHDSSLHALSILGAVVVVKDPGIGIGNARNIGVAAASSDYVLFVGPDNLISDEIVERMLSVFECDKGILGVSCKTAVKVDSFLSYINNLYWKAKIKSGYKKVIGTPSMWRRETLLHTEFDPAAKWSDDEYICSKLSRESARCFFAIDLACEEITQSTLGSFVRRFQAYGVSDYEVFQRNKSTWGWRRKKDSLLHPLRTEILNLFASPLSCGQRIIFLPFAIWFAILRYISWAKCKLSEVRVA